MATLSLYLTCVSCLTYYFYQVSRNVGQENAKLDDDSFEDDDKSIWGSVSNMFGGKKSPGM